MDKVKKYLYPFLIGLIFVLAFVLRIKTYLLKAPLWHDEYSLAGSVLIRNFLGMFQPLEFDQKAPAIFMVLNKLSSKIFGISELSLKFIPFICGLLSVIAFYFLSKRLLNSRVSILAANFLFAINYQLIYWAQKFKPYSFDVLLVISSVLLFTKLDLNKISYKKTLLYSLLSIVLILSSFPCTFVVGGYILYCIFNKTELKKTLAYFLPFGAACIAYYFKVLYGVQSTEIKSFFSYWDTGFLKLNISSLLLVFKENFNFFFTPNNFILIGLILFICGFILLIKDKNKTAKIVFGCLFCAGLFSLFQIYPIWQRTALYLLPISILFISKPLDLISKNKKVVSLILILLFATYFSKYTTFYIYNFFKPSMFQQTDDITIFPKLVEKYKNSDILVINSTTKSDFVYYSNKYKFKPKNVILLPIYRYDKEHYYNLINSLPKGYNYWFIFGWEYSHRKDNPKNSISEHLKSYIKERHLKPLEYYQDANSILMKVRI